MRDVREKAGVPNAEDFRAGGGTPIVVDTQNEVAYAINASGSVFALSGAAGGGITNINVSAGATSANLSKLTFSNGGGVSFGLTNSVITATVATNYQSQGAYLTTAMASNASTAFAGVGETTSTQAGTALGMTVDTAGVNIAYPNWLTTAQPVGAYLTTARASNDAIGLNTAATQVTWTVNSAGISLNAGAYLTTAQPPGAYLTTARASNDAIGLNTALTANGVAWTVNSSGLSLNVPAFLTTARGSTDAVGLATAQTNVTWTVNSAGISVNAGGYAGTGTSATNATFTLNSAGLALSVAAPGAGGGIAAAAGTQTGTSGTIAFVDSNGITFGMSGSTRITAAHNGLTTARASNDAIGLNTAQTNVTWTVNSSGISVNAAGYAGTGTTFAGANISASMTLNSNGMNMSASVAAPGGGAGNTVSYYANANQFFNSQTMTFLQSTSHILPFVVDQNLSFAYMRVGASGSVLAASSTAATTGNTSYTAGHFRSHNIVIYSRGAGASSNSLQSVLSTQVTEAFRLTQSHAANSTQHSYTLNYTFPCSSGTTGFTKNYSSSAASLNYHTSQLTDLTGIKMLEIPFAGSLSPGRYWLAYGVSSTTSTQRTADQSRQGVAFTFLGMSQGTLAFGNLGSATNSSVMPFQPSGSFTTAGGGTTASMDMTRVSSSASQNQLFFQLMRVT